MITLDRRRGSRIEQGYARQLRAVARQVGSIVNGFDPSQDAEIRRALASYSSALNDWAKSTAGRMLQDTLNADRRLWETRAKDMSAALRREILTAPTGQTLQQLMQDQILLITSIPLEAAERVHGLVLEGLGSSKRASDVFREIMRSGEVAEGRAMCIARTETSRAASNLSQSRALYVGSPGYIWRSADDSDVRQSHRAMNGKMVTWGAPPTLDGMTGHAGCLPNCRCYEDIVLPE